MRIIGLVAGLLLSAISGAAVDGEWRVGFLRASTVQATLSGDTADAAMAACQARIAQQPIGTALYTCQAPKYVARIVADAPPPPEPEPPPPTPPPSGALIAVNFDSPPTSENNGGRYTGSVGSLVLDVRNGLPANMFDHVTGAECYGGSGGCAKFYPGTNTGSGKYRGFNPGSYSGGQTQLNLRYLAKWNAALANSSSFKGDYLTNGGSPYWTQSHAPAGAFGRFQLSQSYRGTLYHLHGNGLSSGACASEGYQCCPHAASCSLGNGVSAAGPFEHDEHVGEYVAIEIEQHSNGIFRMYVWTQDRRYNGLYMESRNAPTGVPSITGFSGIYYTDPPAPAGAFMMLDEVVLSDGFIGPPSGF